MALFLRRLIDVLRVGDWITSRRVRAYSAIMLALGIVMFGWLVVTADGIVDFQRRPLGTDFSNVYAAGTWVLNGQPEAPFSPTLQHEMEKKIFGDDTPFYGWHYPPVFLGLAAVLALMPYAVALTIWQAASLAAYLLVMRAIVPRSETWVPALAFPAVLINLTHGQNGLLSAALFGGALILLERRPQIAGILFGLLCYKPQLGIMIPVALAAGERWRAFAAAGATVLVVGLATWLAFGADTWIAFRDSLEFTRNVVLEQGGTGFHKIQSPFAALRLWGAPVAVAYAVQGATIATVAVLLVILWRSEIAVPLKEAALLVGAMLATPYLLDYDLVVMGPAIAFLVAHGLQQGFLDYEKSALAFCWIAPLFGRPFAEYAGIPLGLVALALLFGLVLRRGAVDRSAAAVTAVQNSRLTPR